MKVIGCEGGKDITCLRCPDSKIYYQYSIKCSFKYNSSGCHNERNTNQRKIVWHTTGIPD